MYSWTLSGAPVRLRSVTDWATVASVATAGGTLVLAVATFASIRSANRSARTAERAARTAERSLLVGQRPLLVTSRLEDPEQDLQFTEGQLLMVRGGEAALKVTDEVARSHPPLEEFASQRRDIYVPPGDIGFWQAALRDPTAETFKAVGAAIEAAQPLVVSVLYGDFEGGQRVISQFILRHQGERCLVSAGRHFQIDQPDPREGE